ncbi:YetF domain-containing protein [Synechococcus sp. PCC 7335]|uniref:YetF domain-containing protein n=1 Tax=Synechococcus sp. (strain ATCC 29403 / PCC 7335) TaxID=91464 RepID=UPI0012FACDAF|nr:YetF domain-containing protein [Synechococcus sp. PCC 7335]
MHKMIKARPALLAHDGNYIEDAMVKERVTKDEMLAALREAGLYDIEDAKWIILETDATLSVIPRKDKDYSDAQLESVIGFPPKV